MTNNGYVSINGELKPAETDVIQASNRAFKYGDSLFESIRIVNGEVMFFNNHHARLIAGMEALMMEMDSKFSYSALLQQLRLLIDKNKINEGGRARLTVFRDAEGFYSPQGNRAGYLLEVQPHSDNLYAFPKEGLDVDIYSEIQKPVNKLSIYKTGNALVYIMAALYASQKKLDDVLLINGKNNILEATSSNLFIVSNGVLYTPTLEDGCVGGTMRMNIINIALANNIKVYECSLTPQNLLSADEVFLTSAIRGIRWISGYKSKRYFNSTARKLVEMLNEVALSSAKGPQENASTSQISFPSS